ncbi:PD-(D/E)XK nuclease family protein [Priestia megaterium]
MSLVSKPTELTAKIRKEKADNKRGDTLATAFHNHIEAINSIDYFNILEVEELVLKEQEHAIKKMKSGNDYPKDLPRFSPSSSDKCDRELFYKAIKAEKDIDAPIPFRKRWTRNSTAAHGGFQKQLLEAELLLDNPEFTVMRTDLGLPAWEKSIEDWKVITHNGVQFVIFGMCDGILEYHNKETGKKEKVILEYKTKSNSVAQIKQIKEVGASHFWQCVAYSILFDVNEYLVTYESVAKDKWGTGENARPDFKVFYLKITDKDRKALLDKFAAIAVNLQDGEVSSPNFSKCMFCQYKSRCNEATN